ncbi:MAG: ferritin-like domain-containing protein [Gemmatimonadaceae bacterium]|nr:ferritin-like domain-containing protein [Chitinophagaceae bacterium]
MSRTKTEKDLALLAEKSSDNFSRRKFLGYAGLATALMAGAAACNPTNNLAPNDPVTGVSLGSGDVGILNYAYALEQLEAAFYVKVIMSQYSGITASETAGLTDIRDHEVAHREFFKNALGGMAIPALEFDFSSINFASRDSVLGTAKAFEDLGVSAYNGAGRLLVSPDYLVLAGKIVSVEARHAAYIRDILVRNSFADDSIVDAMGLDVTRKPTEVLPIAQTYIKTPIDASGLPFY